MNIQSLIDIIKETVNSHRLENEGEYARFLWQNESGTRQLGINEYGCADAANILYTINEFPREEKIRNAHTEVLKSLQDKKTGLFTERTHNIIHTTAHCTASLELFDTAPTHPMTALEEYSTPEGVTTLLDGLDWENEAWSESHKGAGIYAALKLSGLGGKEWEKAYFNWLWNNADPQYGYWKKGAIGKNTDNLYKFLGGGFHYMFNIEYAKMPLRYPEKIIDTCLELYRENRIGNDIDDWCDRKNFGKQISFLEIDWIYSITRSLRQCGHRYGECKETIRSFTKNYIDWLYSIDHKTHEGFNDLHLLFGSTCALAELQTFLPGELETDKPLRLVLDRRPFI